MTSKKSRRKLLKAVGVSSVAGVAGCTGQEPCSGDLGPRYLVESETMDWKGGLSSNIQLKVQKVSQDTFSVLIKEYYEEQTVKSKGVLKYEQVERIGGFGVYGERYKDGVVVIFDFRPADLRRRLEGVDSCADSATV